MAAILLCGGCVAGLAGCEAAHGKDQEPGKRAAGIPAGVAMVVEKDIIEKQVFSGRLEAVDRVEIRARVPGYITEMHFEAGKLVEKGALLFVIDPRPYQVELNRATAALASARAKAELAQVELSRAEKLLVDKAIAQREYDERASALKESNANAQAAVAQVEAARLNLSYTRVTAPVAGRVSKEEITPGNLITPAQVLTSVVSTKRIYASFDGDEDTYLRVAAAARQGKAVPVRIALANEQGFPREGRLQFVDNQLDTRAGSIRMRAVFDNADGTLAPGLFARVQLPVANAPVRSLLVDDAAIGTDQDRKFVYVLGAGNKAEYRTIGVGPMDAGLRVVRTGLQPGERIVVNGLQRVHPGDAIAEQAVAMNAAAASPAGKETR
jgi:multidrug efflux system membrane fusion protein